MRDSRADGGRRERPGSPGDECWPDVSGEARPGYPRMVCHQCGDVIGVYEPLVLETAAGRHDTSLAADPGVVLSDRPGYHRACYELLHHDT
jgi:hypothetical protein